MDTAREFLTTRGVSGDAKAYMMSFWVPDSTSWCRISDGWEMVLEGLPRICWRGVKMRGLSESSGEYMVTGLLVRFGISSGSKFVYL